MMTLVLQAKPSILGTETETVRFLLWKIKALLALMGKVWSISKDQPMILEINGALWMDESLELPDL